MTSTADYGQPTDPLASPSLAAWAAAVHAGKVGYARTPDPTTGDLGLPGVAANATGLRTIKADPEMANANVGEYHVGYLARSGHMVWLYLDLTMAGLDYPASSWIDVLTLPAGFRPPTSLLAALTWYAGGISKQTHIRSDGKVQVYNVPSGSVSRDRFHATFATFDPWPTTLPGTQSTPPAGA